MQKKQKKIRYKEQEKNQKLNSLLEKEEEEENATKSIGTKKD